MPQTLRHLHGLAFVLPMPRPNGSEHLQPHYRGGCCSKEMSCQDGLVHSTGMVEAGQIAPLPSRCMAAGLMLWIG